MERKWHLSSQQRIGTERKLRNRRPVGRGQSLHSRHHRATVRRAHRSQGRSHQCRSRPHRQQGDPHHRQVCRRNCDAWLQTRGRVRVAWTNGGQKNQLGCHGPHDRRYRGATLQWHIHCYTCHGHAPQGCCRGGGEARAKAKGEAGKGTEGSGGAAQPTDQS
eukprot:1505391-Amphidinium_carterae.1